MTRKRCNRHSFSWQTEGMNIPNFTSELLQDEDLDAEKEYNIKWVASSLYSGGSDTVCPLQLQLQDACF